MAPAAAAAPQAPDPALQFGLPEHKEVVANTRAALQKIHAQLLALQTAGGRLVFTLDNGQIWNQTESCEELLLRPGDPVTIRRGWLDSYTLASSSGRACSVRRVR